MIRRTRVALGLVMALTLSLTLPAHAKHGNKVKPSGQEAPDKENSALWTQPDDIKSRNLFYGPGGEKDAPHTTYTFEKEDMDGTSPKFIVRDENGVRWKVKMGHEARPETVASRLVWAVGYATNEDYFLPELHVQGLPQHLRRGQKFVGPPGMVHNVRLKRYLEDEKKVGEWHWNDNPFLRTRQLAGLRVMMALINNWDLKDENNSIYREKHRRGSGPEYVFMVSDLGASFGTTGIDWTQALSKGNLHSYEHSKFISKVTPQYVDFNVPTRASLIHIFNFPAYVKRLELRWIGKRIPRADVRWIDHLLTQLSPDQIREAFRAADYPPAEVENYTKVVEKRIAELGNI